MTSYKTWRFNGTFRLDSPYKGPPSASVDTVWERLTDNTRPVLRLRQTFVLRS